MARSGVRVARQSSSSVSCCSKNSPRSNCSTASRSAGGAGSSQRARTGSAISPPGTRFGGRAALRSRLPGVRRSDDLAVAELVLDEFADDRVVERLGEALGRFGERDLDALRKIARGDEIAVRHAIHARVLEVPHRPRLPDLGALELNAALTLGDDLRVLRDLALR